MASANDIIEAPTRIEPARLPERTARRVLGDIVDAGLLASATPKGPVSLRFPVDTLEGLFPRLYRDT